MEVGGEILKGRLHGFSTSTLDYSLFSPKKSQFCIDSIAENRLFMAQSPLLAWVCEEFDILGHSCGCLIAGDKRTRAPTLLNLCTEMMTILPKSPRLLTHGLLTSPLGSGKSILILYEILGLISFIYYFREADPSECWQKFTLPKIHGSDSSVDTITVHEDRLYISISTSDAMESHVMEIDISGGSFNVVRVIEPPCIGLLVGSMSVQDGELITITFSYIGNKKLLRAISIPIWKEKNRVKVHRLELSKGAEGKWVEGLAASHSVLLMMMRQEVVCGGEG